MRQSPLVLVVDCDIDRLRARVQQLRLDGSTAEGAPSLRHAHALIPRTDMLVVAEVDGGPPASLQLVRDVRSGVIEPAASGVPTIAFADDESHLMSCFRAGADMTLPTGASTLLVSASVEALGRRQGGRGGDASVVRLGQLELDTRGRNATVRGADVALTARQFGLLEALAKTPGKVYSRDELSRELWGSPDMKGSRALDAQLSRLSHRLAEAGAGDVIKNVHGRGFKLSADGAER